MMFNHFCSTFLQIRYVGVSASPRVCVCVVIHLKLKWHFLSVMQQDIIRLPRLFRFLQRPLAKLISVLRAPKSKEGYAAIGGGSPLRKITDEQVYINVYFKCLLHCDLCF